MKKILALIFMTMIFLTNCSQPKPGSGSDDDVTKSITLKSSIDRTVVLKPGFQSDISYSIDYDGKTYPIKINGYFSSLTPILFYGAKAGDATSDEYEITAKILIDSGTEKIEITKIKDVTAENVTFDSKLRKELTSKSITSYFATRSGTEYLVFTVHFTDYSKYNFDETKTYTIYGEILTSPARSMFILDRIELNNIVVTPLN